MPNVPMAIYAYGCAVIMKFAGLLVVQLFKRSESSGMTLEAVFILTTDSSN